MDNKEIEKTIIYLISGVIVVSLLVGGSFLIYRNNSAKINLDENIQESPMDFDNYNKNTTRDYIQELVNLALSQEKNINSQQHKISLLWSLGTENFQKEEGIGWGETSGSSAGSAIYLALLSALHKLPISNKVCATGTIKMNEEKVKNLATGQSYFKKRR